MLSKGGINFFSKNFELTMILRNFLNIATEGISNSEAYASITREENFYSIRYNDIINLSKSLLDHPKESLINQTIINQNCHIDITDDFILKINLLQLKHLLEIQFVVIIVFLTV
jgi:hypothetical protein